MTVEIWLICVDGLDAAVNTNGIDALAVSVLDDAIVNSDVMVGKDASIVTGASMI